MLVTRNLALIFAIVNKTALILALGKTRRLDKTDRACTIAESTSKLRVQGTDAPIWPPHSESFGIRN